MFLTLKQFLTPYAPFDVSLNTCSFTFAHLSRTLRCVHKTDQDIDLAGLNICRFKRHSSCHNDEGVESRNMDSDNGVT